MADQDHSESRWPPEPIDARFQFREELVADPLAVEDRGGHSLVRIAEDLKKNRAGNGPLRGRPFQRGSPQTGWDPASARMARTPACSSIPGEARVLSVLHHERHPQPKPWTPGEIVSKIDFKNQRRRWPPNSKKPL